jgi:hypothetical protein
VLLKGGRRGWRSLLVAHEPVERLLERPGEDLQGDGDGPPLRKAQVAQLGRDLLDEFLKDRNKQCDSSAVSAACRELVIQPSQQAHTVLLCDFWRL